MKRNNMIEAPYLDRLTEHKKRIAFHEAGHAAGIHLNNKARNLPPIFFKIMFKDMNEASDAEVMAYQTIHDDCIARVEGGRLIELLPPSLDSLVHELAEQNSVEVDQLIQDYMAAFEADVVNLLIGPLAEAKHVADTDDELFNHRLVNLQALKNYGGSSDIVLANEYLQSYSADKQQREEKLSELFTVAFNFVNNEANWAAISQLADYVLGSNKNTIHCEEIVTLLDQSIVDFEHRRNALTHA